MIIPREIREKIEQRNQLNEEIADWFQENVDADGCDIKNAYVVDEPKGEEQIEEGEYCKQTILGEDWYIGQYYWKMDNGKYLCMDFEIKRRSDRKSIIKRQVQRTCNRCQ